MKPFAPWSLCWKTLKLHSVLDSFGVFAVSYFWLA